MTKTKQEFRTSYEEWCQKRKTVVRDGGPVGGSSEWQPLWCQDQTATRLQSFTSPAPA